MSMTWPTMYSVMDNPPAPASCPGTEMRTEYALSVDQDGRKCLRAIREFNIRDHIQSFAPGCDMAVILNKLHAGLIPIGFDDGNCVDLSLMPKDVVDALHNLGQFKDTFSRMPADVQEMFGYDPNLFINAFVDGTLPTKLQELMESQVEPDKPVDKPDQLESAPAEPVSKE